MKPRLNVSIAILLLIPLAGLSAAGQARPNIVYILTDDLGYGDVHCLNPERGKIATPQMDKMAAEGMVFTDVHASSSVCTPSRYGILTGRYNWRSRLQADVLYSYDPPLIVPDRLTVAGFLKQNGYRTACIGKWHLGLGMPTKDGTEINPEGLTNIDWNGAIKGGPVDLGFDYFYGITASLNIPPYIYIENDRFVGECTVIKAFNRPGPAEKDFEAGETLPLLARKTIEFIQRQDAGTPFFAFVSLTSPHTPIMPTKEWQGKSQVGPYGDFVMQTDAIVGEILAALDQAGLGKNTIVIFTSDNGPSKWAGIQRLEARGHFASAQFRGSKSDIWDGGHRIPFIVRWPERIPVGGHTDQTICLTDLMATCADLVQAKLPDNAGEDSVSFLPALLGQDKEPLREAVVHHSFNGSFAIRQGGWKLELCSDSGGWSDPTPGSEAAKQLPATQLYDLGNDPAEARNVQAGHPEVVARLTGLLNDIIANGRSTPGAKQDNDVAIKIRK